MTKQLIEKIKNAPVDPGCYLYKNKNGTIIYIGKARNIKKRVKSYFIKNNNLKTKKLVKNIQDVEFIITNSEIDALILENNLIKKHKPRYNILLRDDKTFPYVKISNEYYPRIYITRKIVDDGSKYFGPYTETRKLKNTIRLIKKIFLVRRCNRKLTRDNTGPGKQNVCLNFHINRCEGPCIKNISHDQYMNMVQNIEDFLNGDTEKVLNYFEKRMKSAAREMNYEMAAKFRDNIKLINNLYRRQSVENTDFKDRDLISVSIENDKACSLLLKVRQGKVLGRETFFLDCRNEEPVSTVIEKFIQKYYSRTNSFPTEIIVDELPDNRALLDQWLKSMAGKRVRIIKGVRKTKSRLLKMAKKNAGLKLKEYIAKKNKNENFIPLSISNLKKSLNLETFPQRIEGFDISNLSGRHKVASMVCFINGIAKKSEYRRFKIKTVVGANDFASMEEVVRRRYTRVLKEDRELPDLILIDGGKGQLSAAKAVLDHLELDKVPIIGLAKRLEEIFIPGQSNPIMLDKANPALRLLQKIRDESHRFAITYHRKKRNKSTLTSALDNVPGLGEKKKLELYNHYKSIDRIKALSIEDLCDVKGIGPKLAKNIWLFLHNN